MLMGMKTHTIVEALQNLAPLSLAEPWDKVGLHVGSEDWPAGKVLLCIDLTPEVVAEARQKKAQMIVAYHPPIFKPLDCLTDQSWKGRMLLDLVHSRIAVHSPHTALDAAKDGMNDWLAQGLGEGEIHPIEPTQPDAQYKLVTFVPEESADQVRQALSDAGAGNIGDYTECSFSLQGQGSFKGGGSTNPVIGKRGQLEYVKETRLEMLVPAASLANVIATHQKVHPYEEPAYDVYRLETTGGQSSVSTGAGRILSLNKPISMKQLIERVKNRLGVKTLKVATPRSGQKIHRIGICVGAGASLLEKAGNVDAFVTGEMRHHEVLEAVQSGQSIILAGHTNTERPYLPTLARRLKAEIKRLTGEAVPVIVSQSDRSAMVYR